MSSHSRYCFLLVFFMTGASFAIAQAPSAFEDALAAIVDQSEKPQKPKTQPAIKSSAGSQKLSSSSQAHSAGLQPTDKYFKNVYDSINKILLRNAIVTPHFHCLYTRSHSLVWRDKGTGGAFDIGIWRPQLNHGWVRLGDIAVPSMSEDCPSAPALIIYWDDRNPAGDEKGPFLKKPIDYRWVWDSEKSGADRKGSIWYPVPPAGYVSLGLVAQNSWSKPDDLGIVRCVRSDIVLPGKWIGTMWTDKKSGAKHDCAVWTQTVADTYAKKPFLVTGTVHAVGSYDSPPSVPPYVLKGLSGEDAYNDARNGYLKLTRNGMLSRMQLAVANARATDQTELASEANDLQRKLGQVESVAPN
ncbi:MAG TPA: Vps62-related protein, partial [Candidatus Ozemobacteraceae bacterium]|nr:Vps62-related protein [Candidatus Ozemobacteraceae bacterium]